jgi:hypothetical protein
VTEVCGHGIRWPWACHEYDDIAWAEHQAALAAGAQSAETNEDLAQSEGRQSGGSASERNAQSPSPHPKGNLIWIISCPVRSVTRK